MNALFVLSNYFFFYTHFVDATQLALSFFEYFCKRISFGLHKLLSSERYILRFINKFEESDIIFISIQETTIFIKNLEGLVQKNLPKIYAGLMMSHFYFVVVKVAHFHKGHPTILSSRNAAYLLLKVDKMFKVK